MKARHTATKSCCADPITLYLNVIQLSDKPGALKGLLKGSLKISRWVYTNIITYK